MKAPLVLTDANGKIIQRVGEYLTREFTIAGTIGAPLPRPLGRETTVAISKDRVYVGTADSALVDVVGLNGVSTRPVRVQAAERKPTREQHERAADNLVAYQDDATWRTRFKRLFLEMPMPTSLPPYTAVLVDRRENLWVVRSAPGDSEVELQAFSRSGAPLAVARVPRLLTVFEIGADYILGSYEDNENQPHVALYSLRRPSPSR